MDKINVNSILNDLGYNSNNFDNYPEIVKYANDQVNYTGVSVEQVIDNIKTKWGTPPELLKCEDGSGKPLHLFGEELYEDGDESPVEQIKTAMTLPVTTRGALMPDGHLGYALPIGGVVGLNNAISPHFIGYDISCMMYLSILDVNPMDIEENKIQVLDDLDSVTSFGMGADYNRFADQKKRDHDVMYNDWWNEVNDLKQLRDTARNQLGSSGSGNHFANVMNGISTIDIPELGLLAHTPFVALLTHSGSRGVGHKMATKYSKLAKEYTDRVAGNVPNNYEWLSMEDDLGLEYWHVMQLMGQYALANHQIIHQTFSELTNLPIKSQYYNRHNFAWKHGDEYIHRKGATPANKGELGIIPASMATPSRIVRGLGNKESMNSSSHGAGRTMSRTKAKEIHDHDEHSETVKKLDILTKGVAEDESYQAYKDIEDVITSQENVLINDIAKLHPRIVIMGG